LFSAGKFHQKKFVGFIQRQKLSAGGITPTQRVKSLSVIVGFAIAEKSKHNA
jgi:hypothetical protein